MRLAAGDFRCGLRLAIVRAEPFNGEGPARGGQIHDDARVLVRDRTRLLVISGDVRVVDEELGLRGESVSEAPTCRPVGVLHQRIVGFEVRQLNPSLCEVIADRLDAVQARQRR